MNRPTVHEVLQGLSAAGAILDDEELAATAILAGLDAAGFAIVRKPTGDQVKAALAAYDATGHHPSHRYGMAAALAAAEGASYPRLNRIAHLIDDYFKEDDAPPIDVFLADLNEALYGDLPDALAAAAAAECTCGRAWEGHPQPHSIICRAYPAAAAADGRTPDEPVLVDVPDDEPSYQDAYEWKQRYLVDLDDPETVERLAEVVWSTRQGLRPHWSAMNDRARQPSREIAAAVVAALKDGGA